MPATIAIDKVQQRLTEYALSLDYAQLSAEAIHTAKARVIDTLGILIGGYSGEPCRIARDIATRFSNPEGATIIGTRIQTSPEMAAFANGTTARLLEFNDVYHWPGSAHGHPSDVIMPIFAAAEYSRSSGRDFITAIVLAYEVFCQCSNTYDKTVFCNTNLACLGSAIAAGKLMGLSAGELSHCISMAVIPNNILIQVRKDSLSMWKEVAAGYAGRAGIFSAMMARAGMEGPHLPFEGRAGWSANVAGKKFSLDEKFGGKDMPFKILRTRLKMRPCEGEMISSVLAAEKIGPLKNLAGVEKVIVETNEHARWLVGSTLHRPVWDPSSREIADHSIPYVVAAALIDGKLTLRSYDDARLWSPELRALLPKIEVVANDEFTQAYKSMPREHRSRVSVVCRDGQQLVGEAGGGEDDLSAEKSDHQIEEKFRELTEDRLGAKRVNSILNQLWNLEELATVTDIPAAFVLD